ncbi:hypothetical protein FJT64_003271 [Amphibalanus amphitrite]|uniref:C-type lectin domain-containing protein n=1 Tax=Amphibalanus amphitrite TaxID=1232801 RepID=A0A6A4WD25_AMPAM|nr:hypothetical protein FJT64_003271 [Amphibalanus amphitrite]
MHDIDSNPGLRQRPDGDFNWKYEQPTQGALNYFSSIRLSEWANATVTNRDPDHSCLSVPGLSNKLIASDCAEGKTAICVAKADAGCPAGFLRTGSACVYGSQRPSTFTEAQSSCRSLNSELYEPREPGLLADVRELVAKVHPTDHWIGMQEKTSECFYFMDRHSTSQRDAQKRCAAVGGALAEFREESFLTNFLQWRGDDNKRLWTGISDLSENNMFTSPDGLTPTLLPWDTGMGASATLGCTTLHTETNEMADGSCTASQADGYMCLHSSDPANCPAGFLPLRGRCYYFSPTTATHAGASAACSKLASSLAQIDSRDTAVS